MISASIFDFMGFRVWPLTYECHLGLKKLYHSKAHIRLLIWLLWTPSSLTCTVFELFDFKHFRVGPWPMTSEDHLWSKKILFESPYMTYYLTSMDTISLSLTVFEIFDFKVVKVWLWPLTPKDHLGSKFFIPFESTYITFYLTFIDNISLPRTVFEIFDFKVFRVWPWFLTPKGHLGSKKLITIRKHICDFLFDFYR